MFNLKFDEGKIKRYGSVDVLQRRLGIDSFDDDQLRMLAKAEQTGDTLFAMWNPYVGELMGCKEVLMDWIAKEDEVRVQFWKLREAV